MNSIVLPVKATWVEHSKVAGGKMVQVTKMSLGQKCHLDKNVTWTILTLGQKWHLDNVHLDNNGTWTIMSLGQCSLGQYSLGQKSQHQ